MNPASGERGYALLAALLVTTLAAVFAATAVAAVSAGQSIVSSDVASARAKEGAREALVRACLELRRHPASPRGELECLADAPGDASWHASWIAVGGGADAVCPAARVAVEASCGEARTQLAAVLELRAAAVPQGVVTAGDVELRAPLRVIGSGLYSGGSVRGREWLTFESPAAMGTATPPTPPADGVHGDLWTEAGAHALGSLLSAGVETHGASGASQGYLYDTDLHTGDNDVARFVAAPGGATLLALRDAAVAPAAALSDGVLDLARLPLSLPPGLAPGAWEDGYVVVAAVPKGEEVHVVGVRPLGACPVVVVIEGDAALGEVGVETAYDGALLVTGSLRICGPSILHGHLFAGELLVVAPAAVELAGDWRRRPLPGLVAPVVASLSGP